MNSYVTAEMAGRGPAYATQLEAGAAYHGFFVNPKTGAEQDLGAIRGDAEGRWALPKAPIFQDWILVLENAAA